MANDFNLDFDMSPEEEEREDLGFEPKVVELEKVEGPRISIQQRYVMRFIEQIFWETGLVPTMERCIEALSEDFRKGLEDEQGNLTLGADVARAVAATYRNPNVKTVLSQKGIDLYPKVSGKVLTAEQLILANMAMNLHDKRSIREKLKEVGVSSQQWHSWLRQPAYQAYLTKRGEALLGSSEHIALKNLVLAVESKDLNAIKFFFEMTGRYNPKLTIDINVTAILSSVVEVIARHVKDPVALTAIADELDGIIEGTGTKREIV